MQQRIIIPSPHARSLLDNFPESINTLMTYNPTPLSNASHNNPP
jgi:hypothetical protein